MNIHNKTRDIIVEYARTQVALSHAGGAPDKAEREMIELEAKRARVALQMHLNYTTGRNYRLPAKVESK